MRERVHIDSKIQNESEYNFLNNDEAKTNYQIAEEERGMYGGRYQRYTKTKVDTFVLGIRREDFFYERI